MKSNPWLSINPSDYEAHMSHDSVYQLQTLSDLTRRRIQMYKPSSMMFFGACTGNGFEHITLSTKVYAVDINESFLDLCRERYSSTLKDLRCIHGDIGDETLSLPQVDLIICDLIFEYVNIEKVLPRMGALLTSKGILSTVIQKNNNNSFVSDTGVKSLTVLSTIAKEVAEEDITRLIHDNDLIILVRESHLLPNGKEFIRIDCGKNN